jgi:hypothetical protein
MLPRFTVVAAVHVDSGQCWRQSGRQEGGVFLTVVSGRGGAFERVVRKHVRGDGRVERAGALVVEAARVAVRADGRGDSLPDVPLAWNMEQQKRGRSF